MLPETAVRGARLKQKVYSIDQAVRESLQDGEQSGAVQLACAHCRRIRRESAFHCEQCKLDLCSSHANLHRKSETEHSMKKLATPIVEPKKSVSGWDQSEGEDYSPTSSGESESESEDEDDEAPTLTLKAAAVEHFAPTKRPISLISPQSISIVPAKAVQQPAMPLLIVRSALEQAGLNGTEVSEAVECPLQIH